MQLLLGSYVYFANPEANWGSASQAQTILTAMNATQVGILGPDDLQYLTIPDDIQLTC